MVAGLAIPLVQIGSFLLDITKNIVTMGDVMNELVTFAHALADPTRWRIIQLLQEQALCVCEVADILKMPQSSVSSHVQVIRKAGILQSERCEKWIYYRVSPSLRSLVMSLADSFAASPTTDATLKLDAKNAIKRLAKRAESCCPAPKVLCVATQV